MVWSVFDPLCDLGEKITVNNESQALPQYLHQAEIGIKSETSPVPIVQTLILSLSMRPNVS